MGETKEEKITNKKKRKYIKLEKSVLNNKVIEIIKSTSDIKIIYIIKLCEL